MKSRSFSVRGALAVIALILVIVPQNYLEAHAKRSLLDKQHPVSIPKADYPPLGWHLSFQAILPIVASLPPGTRVAATEHGTLGALFPDIYISDMTGLHNPEIAAHGFSAAAALRDNPTLIWLPDNHYTGAVHALTSDPQFIGDYEYFPGLFEYGVAILRSSPLYVQLRERILAHAAEVYRNPPSQEVIDELTNVNE